METLPRPIIVLPAVLVFVLAEAIWRIATNRGYDGGAAAASLAVAAVNALLIKPLTAGVIALVYFAVYDAAPFRLPVDDWRIWLAAFVLVEFVYYWFHRFSHTVRWLWASHAVHHTARELTLPAAIRLGWTNLISGGWLMFAPLAFIGFHPLMIAVLLALNLAHQFLLHTEAVSKLGPLEWVLNTPSHHRVHHACNPRYLDRNFGGVVIVFDRLFGTFAEERDEEKPRYGLVHAFDSKNPLAIALHEWARMGRDLLAARSLNEAANAAFGPPATPR